MRTVIIVLVGGLDQGGSCGEADRTGESQPQLCIQIAVSSSDHAPGQCSQDVWRRTQVSVFLKALP